MKGLPASDWQFANMDEYVAGPIDIDELVTRGLAPTSKTESQTRQSMVVLGAQRHSLC